MERRGFVQSISALIGSMLLAVAGLGTVLIQGVASILNGKSQEGDWIPVDHIDRILPGKPTERTISYLTKDGWEEKNDRQKVLILFEESEPVVYSSSCPHLDCPVSLIPDEERFVCKCHMSYFDVQGKVMEGPSPRGLDPLPTKIEDGVLYCRWVRFQSGGSKSVEI